MSKLTESFAGLDKAFETFTAAGDDSALPEHQQPSALLLTYDPKSRLNARSRVTGDPDALMRVLLMAMDEDEGLREAVVNILPQILAHAD